MSKNILASGMNSGTGNRQMAVVRQTASNPDVFLFYGNERMDKATSLNPELGMVQRTKHGSTFYTPHFDSLHQRKRMARREAETWRCDCRIAFLIGKIGHNRQEIKNLHKPFKIDTRNNDQIDTPLYHYNYL